MDRLRPVLVNPVGSTGRKTFAKNEVHAKNIPLGEGYEFQKQNAADDSGTLGGYSAAAQGGVATG